ncbi:MAG TPA: isopentenyl-diphosphate Delta-isomerase [Candidatus Saccharimonadales bacterium]|nr:isopentenyl-diphosphate Delta-isomerase [Candidatus Saccharimonadales bacterium]
MTPEQIVLVDYAGQPVGKADKLASHHLHTPLHLAFSCYIFNAKGKFLLTRRADSKKVWPGVWTDSLCGHPSPDEDMPAAINRRAQEELGITVHDLIVALPDYRYKTPPFNGVVENEICPVFLARTHDSVKLNPEEVAGYKWVEWSAFVHEALNDTEDRLSWWCKDQLKHLVNHPELHKFIV